MPRRLFGALVALALVPSSASALTPSLAVSSVAAGCQPRGAFAVPVTAAPAFATGAHRYVVATGDAAPCAELAVTTTATDGSVRLRWNAAPGAADYRIYRDGATVATGVACCEYTDASATTTAGAPPAVAAESARAGTSPDLAVTEAFAYDDPDETLGTDVVRLPAGLFLPTAGEALAVIDGEAVAGDITATGDPSKLALTLRPDGADPIVLTMALARRADGALDVTTDTGGVRLDRLVRTFPGTLFPTSCAAKSVLLDADGTHASAPLQATDCAAVPFGPAATLAFDGTTLTADVTQPAGQSAARAIAITLPEGFTTTTGGQATGTSPFAPVAPLPFTASTTAGGRSVLTLDGLPEAPMTDVRFQTPVTRALCAGAPIADATFAGHNGAIATARPAIALPGPPPACATAPDGDDPGEDPPAQLPARPGVAVAARVGRSGRARLALTVRAGNAVAGSNLRVCRVVLPRGLRLTRTARRHLRVRVDAKPAGRTSVAPHRLTVRTTGASRILTVTARRGALSAGRRARHRLAFRFAVLTRSGRTYRIVKRVTPRS